MGRHSAYKPEYADQILEYFDVKALEWEEVDGKRVPRPCSLPTLAGFACKIGVHRDTVRNWAKSNEEFSDAFKMAKDHQERILVENGLMGAYEKSFAIFTAKNLLDWRDKQEHTGKDGGAIEVKDQSSRVDLARRIAFALAQGLDDDSEG